jgi:hypothetical protein
VFDRGASEPRQTPTRAGQGPRSTRPRIGTARASRRLGHGLQQGAVDQHGQPLEHRQGHAAPAGSDPGSHDIGELSHAEWPSYFVSLRTVEIRPFSEAETRLLLTEPLRHSELFRRAETKPPHFDLAFWGEGGSTASTPKRRAGRTWSSSWPRAWSSWSTCGG